MLRNTNTLLVDTTTPVKQTQEISKFSRIKERDRHSLDHRLSNLQIYQKHLIQLRTRSSLRKEKTTTSTLKYKQKLKVNRKSESISSQFPTDTLFKTSHTTLITRNPQYERKTRSSLKSRSP